MLIAVDINAIKEYSLEEDTVDEKTIFLLGQLDSMTRAFLDDLYSDVVKNEEGIDIMKDRTNMKLVDIAKFGLKGWKNFKDSNGVDIPFKVEEKIYPIIGKRTVATDESLNKLQREWKWLIAYEIISINTLTEEDKKK